MFRIACKYRFPVCFVATCVVLILGTPAAYADLNDELLAYWSFDDSTAGDDSCNTHTGTIVGAGVVSGVSGQALWFDGIDDYVQIPDPASFSFSDQSVTFSVWTKVLDSPDDYRIYMSIGHSDWPGEPRLMLGKYRSGMNDGRIFMQIHMGGGNYAEAFADLILPSECWFHVVGVVDWEKGLVQLYINGELQDEVATISYALPTEPDLVLHLGQTPDVAPNGWHYGPLDEVRVYDRALSADEIESLFRMHNPYEANISGGLGGVGVDDFLLLLEHWGLCK
jgi:hypothetical protein